MYAAYRLIQLLLEVEVWIFGCLFAAWLLARSSRRQAQTWARRFLALGIGMFYVFGIAPTGKALIGMLESQYPSLSLVDMQGHDALVVLSGGIRLQPQTNVPTILGTYSGDRLVCGVTLFKQGVSPVLVMSGGVADPFQRKPPEAEAMRDLAIKLGVPAGAVVAEAGSRTTAESAVEVRRRLPHLRRILLVTSAFHLPRAVGAFRKQGFDQVTPVPCNYEVAGYGFDPLDLIPSIHGLRLVNLAVHEYVGFVVYRMLGQL